MNILSIFGVIAVSAMVICYALESRGHAMILAFAASCLLTSVYGFMQGAWPIGIVECIWTLVAIKRWTGARQRKA